jgi:hypothetical protein
VISELTIVVSRRAHLETLRRLSRDLRAERSGLRLHCLCPADLVPEVARSVGPEVAVAALPEGRASGLRRRLHQLLLMLFADEGFSPFFGRRVKIALRVRQSKSAVLRLGRRFTPKLGGPALNRLLARVLSLLTWRRTFPTRRIAVLTMCSAPHLLCTGRHEIVSVMDGWDHPTTRPVGYQSEAVAAWNDDLADDWNRMQGARKVVAGYPYRFAYLLQDESRRGPAAAGSGGHGVRLLYAMATFPSRAALDRARHEEEIAVVRELFGWLLPHVASFEVKPHPIGPAGHIDGLAQECPGLVVHPYETSGASTYDLTDSYNSERLATLASADLVLGIWTTFLLDAAVAGRAIALVDLPSDTPLEALWTAQLGLHVHHLRERVSAVVSLSSEGPAFGGGAAGFEDFMDRAMESGQRVARWVVPAAGSRGLTRALLADSLRPGDGPRGSGREPA